MELSTDTTTSCRRIPGPEFLVSVASLPGYFESMGAYA